VLNEWKMTPARASDDGQDSTHAQRFSLLYVELLVLVYTAKVTTHEIASGVFFLIFPLLRSL
jgi:hypothetical protein